MPSNQTETMHTTVRNTLSNVRWKLVVPLAALGLVRTVPGIIGSEDPFWVSLLVILLLPVVTAVWIGVVLWQRVPNPFTTLVFTGVMYGILAMVLNVAIQGDFSKLPLIGVVAILVVNLIWGTIAGFIAVGIRRLWTRA